MKEIYRRIFEENLTPNSLYILYCSRELREPNESINYNLELRRLIADGWIVDNKLTTKAINFLLDLDKLFKPTKKPDVSSILGQDFDKKIEEYLEIFPKFKLPSGKYARTDKKNLENNFRWFFETHSYDWDTVLNATKMYVDEYERQGYKYMRTSQYFIRKQNAIEKTFESELANYCEVYMNGDGDYKSSHFSERVV